MTGTSVDESLVIRTPDQRLRVFVSSTLGELAGERAAVRSAIERLRLAPVMFELGARAHPPRALYRAYLQQSHIFIGIYWQSYGWVAPEMAISGIEDEYELSSDKPCLVYVKDPAPEREQRLDEFLRRVEREDRVSYKRFQTPEQLLDLVADDLALLLTEHFETAAQGATAAEVSALRPPPLPVAPTRLLGRERDVEAVCRLIERGDVRLLTLSGVGGIGKTRLALAAAAKLQTSFADGVGFADLSSVHAPELVPGVVARAIGVPREGTRPVGELVIDRLTGAQLLLVLDNFEHVIAASQFLAELLASCREVKALATSRALLRLRGERDFPVMPLEIPPVGEPPSSQGALAAAAVQLFVERAQDQQPGFALEDANAEDVVELCARLEGIPLAIELAAARVKVLAPGALLERIEHRLDLLRGPSDLPERQRTLRATIDWSYELLQPQERELFAELSVFVGGFTLDSAHAVCNGEGDRDVLEGVSSLIEKSLVATQEQPGLDPRFRMLETVREYAQQRLERSANAQSTQLRMARYVAQLAEEATNGLNSSDSRAWIARLDAEVDNWRAATSWALENGEPELFVRIATLPWMWSWPRGYVPEMRPLFERCLASYPSLDPATHALQLYAATSARVICGETEAAIGLLQELIELTRELGDERGRALAQWSYSAISQTISATERKAMLADSADTLRRLGDHNGAMFVLGDLGNFALLDGSPTDAERFAQEALEHAKLIDSDAGIAVVFDQLGLCALGHGDVGLARERFADAARTFQAIQDREGLTYAIDGLAAVALAQDKPELAAIGVGAADATRAQLGVGVYPAQQAFREPTLLGVRAALGAAAFEAQHAAGANTDPDHAIEQLLTLTA